MSFSADSNYSMYIIFMHVILERSFVDVDGRVDSFSTTAWPAMPLKYISLSMGNAKRTESSGHQTHQSLDQARVSPARRYGETTIDGCREACRGVQKP